MTFHLVSLAKFNEVERYMSTVSYLTVEWVDDRMEWNPDLNAGTKELTIRSDNVWIPELLLANPADKIAMFKSMETVVRYSSSGHATWTPGDVLKTTCFIQIPGYPFDEHTCWIQIVLWGQNMHEVIVDTPIDHMVTTLYNENTVWEKKGTSAGRLDNEEVSIVMFGLALARRPAVHVLNVIVPIVFLSLMNVQVFLLPVRCGERVSFAVTILLSFTVFLTIVGDNIPKTSSPMPYLCYYIISVLVTSGCITIATVVSQKMYHTSHTKPVPRWLKYFAGQGRKIDVAMATDCCDLNQQDVSEDKMAEADCNKEVGKSESCAVTWENVSVTVDRFFFAFFLLVVVTLATGYIGVMWSHRHYQPE